jgi:UTP--glucose-1-phosphate uridylyltransferase
MNNITLSLINIYFALYNKSMTLNKYDSLFEQVNIDPEMTRKILSRINSEQTDNEETNFSFPDSSESDIVHPDKNLKYSISAIDAESRIKKLLPEINLKDFALEILDGKMLFSYQGLRKLGLYLLNVTTYGILNGGSATSYIDKKRNSTYHPPLFSLIEEPFKTISNTCQNTPKAITPAFINPDGTPGYSFIEMKMRSILLLMLEAEVVTGNKVIIPIFEMRNKETTNQIDSVYNQLSKSNLLQELIKKTGFDITQVESAIQPLIAALTPKSEGYPKKIFTKAYGKENSLLALPGGHGQNFEVLKDIYSNFKRHNYAFSYLVNVDNLGNTPNPVHIALIALSGADGAFEFSEKTPVDVKGGILVKNSKQHFTCADIGVAIKAEDIEKAESNGAELLFNCATGLFSLSYLTDNIEYISSNLPIRISEQDKDPGKYAQAEQITWEVISLIKNPLIFAVKKKKRFLAAKLLSEMILTSQADKLSPKLLAADPNYDTLCTQCLEMQDGLFTLLKTTYGLKIENGQWQPIAVVDLIKSFSAG